MKDALDTMKHILQKLLRTDDDGDDDDRREEIVFQRQECIWEKILSPNTYFTFRQHIGEKLLDLSRTVMRFA